MGDKTPATTQTQSQSSPWSAATPLLQNLISKYSGMNTDVTGGQSTALSNLNTSAAGIPNFGSTGATGVNRLFNTDTTGQIGMLNSGYDTLNKNIGGTASGAELDPYSTPGFGDALSTLTNDITKNVKGVYAGSGRDPSGAGSFAGTLSRGLVQGEAPIIQSQYNANKQNQMNAANTLYGASNATAGNITQQGQVPLSNILQGLQGAGMIPGLYTAPAAAQVTAANAAQAQPFSNLSPQLTAALGLGALGTNTTGTGTQTPANDPLSNWIGGLSAAAGGAGMLFSDSRVKDDIAEVGKLHDGQKVYSYRYKGDNTPQLGLIAQEVLDHEPDAVHDVGGVLALDYGAATKKARYLGSIKAGMLEAAA